MKRSQLDVNSLTACEFESLRNTTNCSLGRHGSELSAEFTPMPSTAPTPSQAMQSDHYGFGTRLILHGRIRKDKVAPDTGAAVEDEVFKMAHRCDRERIEGRQP